MSELSDPSLKKSQSLREPQGHQQRSSSHLHVSYSLKDAQAANINNNNNNRRKSIFPTELPDVSVENVQSETIELQAHKLSQSFRINSHNQKRSRDSNTPRRTSNPESGHNREDFNEDERRDSKIQVFVENMLRNRKSTLAPEGNELGSRRQWVFPVSLLQFVLLILAS